MGKKGWIKKDTEMQKTVSELEEVANKGVYQNLLSQANKLAKHAKGVSITTQRQYYNHFDQFLRFAADRFNLKKVANLSGKHLAAYIEERQATGYSAGTIKNDLAAIRYFHDQLPKARNHLPDNKDLEKKFQISLERRVFGGVNRRWTEFEYQQMVTLAYELKHPQTAHILHLAREQGLRIHEIVRLSKTDVEKALKNPKDLLLVKGKGGLVREIPLCESTKSLLKDYIKDIQHDQKLFVPAGKKAHQVIQGVQDFIQNHREKVMDLAARSPGVHMTIHGLRHSYSKEEYDSRIAAGMEEEQARREVSKLIGHSREDVTKIYLAD
jgi:integrase/recombinase XerD